MTRIIAGVAGGRRLRTPTGMRTRPTTERAREGLFATVASLRGEVCGARVLDLYAGSGALGLEALSRGAACALLVESDPTVARLAADNAVTLGLSGAQVLRAGVETLPGRARGPEAGAGYDLVLADPPYATAVEEIARVLLGLAEAGWLSEGALTVVERPSRDVWAWPSGFTGVRQRRYGETTLWYGLWYGHAGHVESGADPQAGPGRQDRAPAEEVP